MPPKAGSNSRSENSQSPFVAGDFVQTPVFFKQPMVNKLLAEGKADRVLLIKKTSILDQRAQFDEARELLLRLNRQYPNDRLVLKNLSL